MKVALIDTGISEKEIVIGSRVRHFSLVEKKLMEEYKEPEDNHGTHCYKEIVSNTKNKEVLILDLNIYDEMGNLEVSHIISAIEKAIEERVDIINISLGLTTYSQELYDMCNKAIQNNIIVLSAASHTNTVSFPADFRNVICVNVDQQQMERIKTVDYTTVSVSMRDFIVKEGDNEFDFSSSSLACARLCGYFCDDLKGIPIIDKSKILYQKYNININCSKENDCYKKIKRNSIFDILLINRVAVVLFPSDTIKKINNEIIHKNIVAFFNHEKGDFYSLDTFKPTKEFDVIMVLNAAAATLEVPVTIKEKYRDYRMIYIGKFSNRDSNSYLYDYMNYRSSEMAVLEKPVIAITSLCTGLNKSDVQISLLNSFKQDELKIESVTNNPVGLLFNADVFSFPQELKFPDIVYCINKFMYFSEVNKDIDAWLINIGGAIDQVNNLNTYNFGMLVDAYLSAANIDVVIMCVNPSIDIPNLKLQLANLYKHGVKKIFIVLSHNDINASTMDCRDGLQTYYIDDIKYNIAFNYIEENIEEKVLTLNDVQTGKLYESIIETLS